MSLDSIVHPSEASQIYRPESEARRSVMTKRPYPSSSACSGKPAPSLVHCTRTGPLPIRDVAEQLNRTVLPTVYISIFGALIVISMVRGRSVETQGPGVVVVMLAKKYHIINKLYLLNI